MFETVLTINSNTNNCWYGIISHFILGLIYFKYLKDIEKCVCVNKELVYNVKKYYIISILFYFMVCLELVHNSKFILILLFIIVLSNIMFVYNVRKLIDQIYKENCKCANTNYTSIINILNAISIGFYIQCVISIIYFIYISNKMNNETIYINNVDNNEFNNEDNNEDEDCNIDITDLYESFNDDDNNDCSNYVDNEYNEIYQHTNAEAEREYKEIMKFLKKYRMEGGHIELLAKNALKYDRLQLKDILQTCIKKK